MGTFSGGPGRSCQQSASSTDTGQVCLPSSAPSHLPSPSACGSVPHPHLLFPSLNLPCLGHLGDIPGSRRHPSSFLATSSCWKPVTFLQSTLEMAVLPTTITSPVKGNASWSRVGVQRDPSFHTLRAGSPLGLSSRFPQTRLPEYVRNLTLPLPVGSVLPCTGALGGGPPSLQCLFLPFLPSLMASDFCPWLQPHLTHLKTCYRLIELLLYCLLFSRDCSTWWIMCWGRG